MAGGEYVCPVCEQPVDTVVRRHKTMGVFVPVWGPGPCQNPQCAAYEEEDAEAEPVLTAEPGPPDAPESQAERDS